MAKAQHSTKYRNLPKLLIQLRTDAGLTQRDLGTRMKKPQSWIYKCESANRRVDVTEFVAWCGACGVDPMKAFKRVIDQLQ